MTIEVFLGLKSKEVKLGETTSHTNSVDVMVWKDPSCQEAEMLMIACNEDDSGGEVRVVVDTQDAVSEKNKKGLLIDGLLHYEVEADIESGGEYSRWVYLEPKRGAKLIVRHKQPSK